ncbi:RHS repeat-associated core domain-containing protein [Bdellovibrio sp. ZAP7]|uniref:RHS repeat-associated core domain-containing protein n=1 Tax=Bdellovibrio sp. ZAP7 TaxID=2231053 RepID=UPI00143D4EC2|nr:RHS repeat-associated core domain-containing protein [Bdellovibrio sp. ZAP7]
MPSQTFVTLGTFKAKSLGLGGWIPSNFVYYDVNAKKIYKADGSVRNVEAKSLSTGQYLVPEEDGSLAYVFNSQGKLVNTKSGLLGTTLLTFSYDGNGLLSSITDAFARVVTFTRDGSGNLTSIVAPKGQTSTVSLNTNGFLTGVTNPNSETYQMSYSGTSGLLVTFQKPGLQTNTFTYDLDGYLTQDSHSGGYFFDLIKGINPPYAQVSVTTGLGRTNVYTLNGTGSSANTYHSYPSGVQSSIGYSIDPYQLYETVYEDGVTVNTTSYRNERYSNGAYYQASKYFTYASASYTINTTHNFTLLDPDDPFSISALAYQSTKDSLVVNSVFNPATKEWTNSTSMGKTNKVGLDSYERIISQKQGNLNSTTFTYTGANLTQINQGTRQTQFAYDATTGFLSSVTNPFSQTTIFGYDAAGRLTSQVLPDLRVIGYSYDSNGNLSSITPPGRPAHNFGFNSSELINSYEPPTLSGVSVVNTTYAYNADKQLTSITRPDGAVINFYYNPTTGVLETYDTPAGVYSQSMDYSTGLPSSITTAAGISTSITYIQTSLGDTSIYSSTGSLLGSYSQSMASTGLIQTDTVTNPTGTTSAINYLYDNDEYLKKAGDVSLTYNTPNGQLTGTTMGTGATGFTDSYTYNTYGEVTGYQAKRGTTIIYDLTLTRDGMGRISGKSQTMNSTTNAYVYNFDSSGRLDQVTKNSVVASNYGYDSNSNRTSGNVGAQATTATYDDQDRLLTYNTLSFTYNANGDLLTKTNSTTSQTTQYTYDVFGNLTKVILPGGTPTTITYEIDGLNRRIGKKVGSAVQRRFVYMDQYRIAAELNSAGTITKRFIYGSKSNIPDYMIASGVKYRIISDQLGSPRLVVKQSDGTITQRMDHDEFGRVIEDTNPGFTPFGFAGGLYDYQTGIVRFGARDYDPEIGRWTAKDPIDFDGGDANLYGYVENEPVNWIDINGASKSRALRIPDAGGGGGAPIGGAKPGPAPRVPPSQPVAPKAPVTGETCPISGYTKHGINTAISRADGGSMSPRAILNTVKSPTSTSPNPGGGIVYNGPSGTVVLNSSGKVITVIPSGSGSFRGSPGN